MWACGTHSQKPHGVHLTSAQQSCSSKCMQSHTVDWPLPGRGLGDAEKPQSDMAFVLIVPSLAIGCEWVFGLTAMWAHPHQAHLPTLRDIAQKLMFLANESPNWPYAYVQMNGTMAHAPLSSEGHIGVMTDGMPSKNACSCLDQLQVQKLLYCKGWVVCPEGLNRGLEVLLFDFKDLLLWNAASVDEPTWDLSLTEVDLSSTEPEATNTMPVPPPSPAIGPLHDIAMAFNLHLQRALVWLQWTSPATSTPISQHSMPGRKLSSAALGLHPPPEQKIHLPWGDGLGHPWSNGHLFTGIPMCGHARKHP